VNFSIKKCFQLRCIMRLHFAGEDECKLPSPQRTSVSLDLFFRFRNKFRYGKTFINTGTKGDGEDVVHD